MTRLMRMRNYRMESRWIFMRTSWIICLRFRVSHRHLQDQYAHPKVARPYTFCWALANLPESSFVAPLKSNAKVHSPGKPILAHEGHDMNLLSCAHHVHLYILHKHVHIAFWPCVRTHQQSTRGRLLWLICLELKLYCYRCSQCSAADSTVETSDQRGCSNARRWRLGWSLSRTEGALASRLTTGWTWWHKHSECDSSRPRNLTGSI